MLVLEESAVGTGISLVNQIGKLLETLKLRGRFMHDFTCKLIRHHKKQQQQQKKIRPQVTTATATVSQPPTVLTVTPGAAPADTKTVTMTVTSTSSATSTSINPCQSVAICYATVLPDSTTTTSLCVPARMCMTRGGSKTLQSATTVAPTSTAASGATNSNVDIAALAKAIVDALGTNK